MSDVLRKLSSSPAHALELGKAAEHLVCADLILSGYRCYLSDQGLPYDVVVDIDGKLLRIQVKSTCFAKNLNAAGKVERVGYGFGVRRRGKGGSARLSDTDCDVVALVALDIRAIAYLPIAMAGQSVQIGAPGKPLKTKFTSGSQWARNIDEFPFSEAISGDLSIYRDAKRIRTHCVRGHEFTDDNTYINKGGSKICKACTKLIYRRKKIRLSDVFISSGARNDAA